MELAFARRNTLRTSLHGFKAFSLYLGRGWKSIGSTDTFESIYIQGIRREDQVTLHRNVKGKKWPGEAVLKTAHRSQKVSTGLGQFSYPFSSNFKPTSPYVFLLLWLCYSHSFLLSVIVFIHCHSICPEFSSSYFNSVRVPSSREYPLLSQAIGDSSLVSHNSPLRNSAISLHSLYHRFHSHIDRRLFTWRHRH